MTCEVAADDAVAELTGMLGAQLSFTGADGWRFQAFATDTRVGQLAPLEVHHRAHARVEDRIRCTKNTGLARLPSRQFAINATWVELALTAADLSPGPRPPCSRAS
jgi:hypothetical protein